MLVKGELGEGLNMAVDTIRSNKLRSSLTVLGILILRVMRNGIVLIGVPGLAYNIFIGAIILGMMALHSWLERRHQAGT